MKIIVKNIKGEKKEIDVMENSLVSDIQKEVESLFGVTVESQRLIYKGKNLIASNPLSEYNIKESDCIILMTLKLETLKKKDIAEE